MEKIITITTATPYWSDLRDQLLKYIKQKNQVLSLEKKMKLHKLVNNFCNQGTGFQKTIYKFIDYQLRFYLQNENKTKQKYDRFVKMLTDVCFSIDDSYLKKHPKYKKTIYSIKELSEMHWNDFNY